MKILLLTLSLFIGGQALSQEKEIEFGKILTRDLEMESYDKDKEAKAIILYDKGESFFFDTEKGYDIQFTRHKRIKIFDKSESQHAEVSIPYYVDGYGRTENVKSIEAITHNLENGRRIQKKVDPSTVYEEQINDRWFNKKFVFPDVQNGSVLEFRYVLETPFHFNLPDWTFQDRIPTIYSEYEVSMIPFYEYVFRVQGISKFDYQTSVVSKIDRTWGNVVKSYGKNVGNGVEFKDYVHTYVLKDVPAFKDESYISSPNDYIIKMDFQLAKFHSPNGNTSEIISTWPELSKALFKNDNFGKYLKKSSKQAREILQEDLELSDLDETQMAAKIIEYVKNSFEWNSHNSKYASQSTNDFLKNKAGNAAEINLFLIALLNEAGIEAEPLILSTRNHGKINGNYPFDHFTNYVIAMVNTSSPFLADATEDLLPFNMLPPRCFNEKGLVVRKDGKTEWIRLDSNRLSVERQVITMNIDSLSLDANIMAIIQSTEYDSYSNRREFGDDTLEIREYFSDKIGDIETVQTQGYENISSPYFMNFQGKFETEKINKSIVIKPFLHLPLSTNQLKQKERSYPVDFVYPWEEQFQTVLKVPENYTVPALPAPFKVNDELAEINLDYVLSNGFLMAKGNYKFKKSIYEANEYPKVKKYFDDIVKYFNQPVVLELKEEGEGL